MLSVTLLQIYAQYKTTMNKDEVIESYLYFVLDKNEYANIVGFLDLSFYIFHKCRSSTSQINDTTNKNVIKLIFDVHVLIA